MSKHVRLFLLALIISLMTSGVTLAREIQRGENCNVPAGSVIEGTLFAFCQNLNIAGTVEGNVIGIGLRASIAGDIGGNIYLAGLELDLSGVVRGDLHYVGLMLDLADAASAPSRPVLGQAFFAALTFTLRKDAKVLGPISGFGYQAIIDGAVHGEVNYWGSAFALNGALHGDVFATVGSPESDVSDITTLLLPLDIEFAPAAPGLVISAHGNIVGNLEYVGPVEADISGDVAGEIRYISSVPVFIPELPQSGLTNVFYENFIPELSSLLTVGLVAMALAGRRFRYTLTHLRRRPSASFVIGMLLFIISFPITLILMICTLAIILLLLVINLDGVALPVGAFLALVDIGVIGTFYFCAIFLARALFALGLGRLVLQFAFGRAKARRMPRVSIIVGVALLTLLTSLPLVGFLFNAGALFLGLGAIASTTMGWLRSARRGRLGQVPASADTALSAYEKPDLSAAKHPLPAEGPLLLPAQPGLDNLPVGFDPDFFFSDD